MAIYTRTGDHGDTALYTGQRVSKSHPRVEAYGTLDELNAALSLCWCAAVREENKAQLTRFQQQLFWLSAELASEASEPVPGRRYISSEDISDMEHTIDRCMAAVPVVKNFVLPGRCEAASHLHVARTLARRAERRMVVLAGSVPVRQVAMQYINRLSDCLYALARDEDNLAVINQLTQTILQRYQAALATHSTGASTTATQQPTAPGTLPFGVIHQMACAAMGAAKNAGIPVVFSLVDAHGNLLLTLRMPGALLASCELAPKKAWTAVALKAPTHTLGEATQPGGSLYELVSSMAGKVVTFGGGFPLWQAGTLLGGLGISGGTVEQDMAIARAALAGTHFSDETAHSQQ